MPVFEYETSPKALLTASRCAAGCARAAADRSLASTAARSPSLCSARVAGLSNASPPRVPPVSRPRCCPVAAPTAAHITSAALQTASQRGIRRSAALPGGAACRRTSITACRYGCTACRSIQIFEEPLGEFMVVRTAQADSLSGRAGAAAGTTRRPGEPARGVFGWGPPAGRPSWQKRRAFRLCDTPARETHAAVAHCVACRGPPADACGKF